MSLNKKLSLFFVSLYLLSIALFTLVSLIAIRHVLISYAYGYMERYANPIVEFYLEAYKDIDKRISSLAEDLAGEDIGALVVDSKGEIVSFVPPFREEVVNLPKPEVFLREKKGVYENYAFLTKKVGEKYTVILLFRLKSIQKVQDELIRFVVLTASVVSIFILILVPPIIKRFLEPLSYLTSISQKISKEGPLGVEVAEAKTEDELGQLQKAYKDMVDRLKEVITWQINFMRDITHALNTPLTYIKGQIELISEGFYKGEELKAVLQKLLQQTNRMETLIKKLMLLMRLQSHVPLSYRTFYINQLFAELEEEYEFIKESHVFRVEYLSEDIPWEGDYDYLKLALANLLENAYKYTPKGGLIKLYYTDDCIVVEDSGVGIEDKERVFDAFYRENKEKEGFGLGLAIVKAIAQKQGLSIHLESEKGKGTKVYLCRRLTP
jgi:signal transduction histidine kinase